MLAKFLGWLWIVGLVVGTVVVITTNNQAWKGILLGLGLVAICGGIFVTIGVAMMADKLMRYGSEGSIAMQVYPYGKWVKYADAAELEAENKRLHHEAAERAANMKRLMLSHRTAEARLTAALEVLKAVEWPNHDGIARYCHKCQRYEHCGHAPGCTLDAVLNKGERA